MNQLQKLSGKIQIIFKETRGQWFVKHLQFAPQPNRKPCLGKKRQEEEYEISGSLKQASGW